MSVSVKNSPTRVTICYRKGDPFQGLKLSSCLTLGNELSEETHVLTKQEILLGQSTRVESSRVREPRRTVLLRGSQSGFMVMGLVSRWSLANHSNSGSFLVVHTLLSQDGFWREGFWEVDRHAVSPFNHSQTLPVGGGLLVPYSLLGSPVIKQLMQVVTMVPGQGGRFNQCVSPTISWRE